MSAVVPKKPGGVPVQHGRVRVEGDAAQLRLHAVLRAAHVAHVASREGQVAAQAPRRRLALAVALFVARPTGCPPSLRETTAVVQTNFSVI